MAAIVFKNEDGQWKIAKIFKRIVGGAEAKDKLRSVDRVNCNADGNTLFSGMSTRAANSTFDLFSPDPAGG